MNTAGTSRGGGRGRWGGIMMALSCILGALAGARGDPAHTNIAIYASIVIHNEENAPYVDQPDLFWIQRTGLVNFATMLASNGAALNWQSDWVFLDAVDLYDGGTPETDGTNVVAWLVARGFECDPHAHESKKNYADVALRFERLGVTPSDVVGGFVAAPPASSKLLHVSGPISSVEDPSYVWTPTLLWGGAKAGHVDETNLWASGIWRPAGVTNFMWHAEDPNRLPHIGGFSSGRQRWTNLARLVEWRDEGRLTTGRVYSVAFFYTQGELNAACADVDARLKAAASIPNLHWVGLSELHAIWVNEYGARPNILPYDLSLDNDGDGLPDEWEVFHNHDVSWTNGEGDADGDGISDRGEWAADTDPFNASSLPVVAACFADGDRTIVRITCTNSRLYDLEGLMDLPAGNWFSIPGQGNRPGDESGLLTFTVTNRMSRSCFRYRVRLP